MKNTKFLLALVIIFMLMLLTACTPDTILINGTYKPDIEELDISVDSTGKRTIRARGYYTSITLKKEADRTISGSYVLKSNGKTYKIKNAFMYSHGGAIVINSSSGNFWATINNHGKVLITNGGRYKKQ